MIFYVTFLLWKAKLFKFNFVLKVSSFLKMLCHQCDQNVRLNCRPRGIFCFYQVPKVFTLLKIYILSNFKITLKSPNIWISFRKSIANELIKLPKYHITLSPTLCTMYKLFFKRKLPRNKRSNNWPWKVIFLMSHPGNFFVHFLSFSSKQTAAVTTFQPLAS